jgi:proton-dependent oligopeptide transporter, POT family
MKVIDIIQENRSPLLLLSVVLWEFFSYFGMRALLILYLTQKIGFSDQRAYALYGAFTSLIFLTPIIGGWLADNVLGFKRAMGIGFALMIGGLLVLSINSSYSLYAGLSLLICGAGFFKTNAICLIGNYYQDQPEKKQVVYSLYYVIANIGATLGPILCAVVSEKLNYSAAFLLAATGMAIGLTTLLLLKQNVNKVDGRSSNKISSKQKTSLGLGILIAIGFVSVVLKDNIAGYLLSAVSIAALLYMTKVFKLASRIQKRGLLWGLLLTLFGTVFWIYDMQGSSSISLFISRNVDRLGIPTAMFQSINPIAILLFGAVIALIWKKLANRQPSYIFKVIIGFTLLTIGFVCISLSAKAATATGSTSLWTTVSGLIIIGIAELFIDPVILTQLNNATPKNSLGVVTGLYYVFVGAIANFIAGKVAGLTAIPSNITSTIQIANIYSSTYFKLSLIGGFLLLVLLAIWAIRYLGRNANTAKNTFSTFNKNLSQS